jgi:hypothetical protein
MYRTISTQLWTDPAVKQLDAATKLLFIYLITNPHTHLSGIYSLAEETLLKETGLKKVSFRYGIETLSRLEKASRDDENEVIFIHNMFRYQGTGEKNDRSAAKHLTTLHHSYLITNFLARYPSVIPYLNGYPIDTYSHSGKRCPSVPDPVPSSPKKALSSFSLPSSSVKTPDLKSTNQAGKSAATWLAYAAAFHSRYGVEPVRNAKTNSCLCQLVDRLGLEAPNVAAFYCSHDAQLYVRGKHCVDLLVRDAEGLRMEWVTGRQVTSGQAALLDRTSTTGAIVKKLIAEAEETHDVDRHS